VQPFVRSTVAVTVSVARVEIRNKLRDLDLDTKKSSTPPGGHVHDMIILGVSSPAIQ
jgi:hypothetical protein